MIEEYNKNGYLIEKNLLEEKEVNILKEKFYEIFNNNKNIKGNGKVTELRNIANTNGINEIKNKAMYSWCHFYKNDTIFLKMCYHDKITNIAKAILSSNDLQLFDQQLLYKPAINGEIVDWHQDNSYWGCKNTQEITSVWIALTDANKSNGCLWVIPQSHKKTYDFITSPIYGNKTIGFNEKEAIPLIVNAGDAIFLDALTIHCTKENNSNSDRIALEMAWTTIGAKNKNNKDIRNSSFIIPENKNNYKPNL